MFIIRKISYHLIVSNSMEDLFHTFQLGSSTNSKPASFIHCHLVKAWNAVTYSQCFLVCRFKQTIGHFIPEKNIQFIQKRTEHEKYDDSIFILSVFKVLKTFSIWLWKSIFQGERCKIFQSNSKIHLSEDVWLIRVWVWRQHNSLWRFTLIIIHFTLYSTWNFKSSSSKM